MKKRERVAVEKYIVSNLPTTGQLTFTAQDVVTASDSPLNLRAVRKALQNMAYCRLGLVGVGSGTYAVAADNVNVDSWRETATVDLKKIHRRRGTAVVGRPRKAARHKPKNFSESLRDELERSLVALADEHFKAKRDAFRDRVKELVNEFLS